jgi:hypothetical protein
MPKLKHTHTHTQDIRVLKDLKKHTLQKEKWTKGGAGRSPGERWWGQSNQCTIQAQWILPVQRIYPNKKQTNELIIAQQRHLAWVPC